jgi:hypothetical protein
MANTATWAVGRSHLALVGSCARGVGRFESRGICGLVSRAT